MIVKNSRLESGVKGTGNENADMRKPLYKGVHIPQKNGYHDSKTGFLSHFLEMNCKNKFHILLYW